MKHRATSETVEAMKADLLARVRPFVRIDTALERLLQAQDDATLDSLDSQTIGGASPVHIELDRYRHSAGMIYDDTEEAA